MSTRPNVIFIITHDVGPVYGCYGNGQIHTPNIDALAGESVRFDNHYCQWPLCGPSRASLFTGCGPLTTERFNNKPFFREFRRRAPAGFRSLPEHFATSGWTSFATGWVYHDDVDPPSWSAGHALPAPSTERVPEWAEGWLDAGALFEWKAPESHELIRARLEAVQRAGVTREEFRTPKGERAARGPAVESADVPDEAYYDGQVALQAEQFIGDHTSEAPYFLGVGFVAPHTPFRAPSRYWELYDRDELQLPPHLEWPRGSEEWMSGDSEPAQYYTTHGYTRPWRPNNEQLRELLHGHYAAISYIDALIGQILSAARARDDWDDTIVVFTSDHGFSEGQHGYWGKHNMWDASLHVPLILRPPGERAGPDEVERITEHLDIYPSLCELAGLAVPDHCEGRSAVMLLGSSRHEEPPAAEVSATGVTETWDDCAVSHRKHMWHDRLQVYDVANSIRTPRYRYTEYLGVHGELLGEELFDYEVDPNESANHACEAEYARVHAELSQLLHRQMVRSSAEGTA